MSEILSTWKAIAQYLGVSVAYAKSLAKKHDDFPIFREHRVFTTTKALSEWIHKKIICLKENQL